MLQDSRGGVLGAMETGYQRGRIQEEPMFSEHRKHDGSYPIIGVMVDAVRVCSLGQITPALFEADGQYRRNM